MESFVCLNLEGEGSFGRVYKGRRLGCGQVVALKFLPKHGRADAELLALRRELDILRTLRHPNIVQMLDCFETEDALCAVTEFASGTLFEVLQGDTALPEAAVLPIAAQLVDALHYLHSHRVIHRDMKPQNILLGANSRVMLCDFGFARAMSQQTTVLASIKGTPLYMAPELLQEQPYDHTADLWALGVILYELYIGRPPFDTHNFFALVSMIVSKDVSRPENASLPFGSLLEGLLTKDPRRRLSYPALLHHPFLRGPCQQRTPAMVPHHALALRANFPGAFLSVLPVGCRDEEGAATRGAHAEAPPGPDGGGPVRAALAPGLEHAAQPSPPGGGASGERSTSPQEPSSPRSGSRPRDTTQEEVGRLLDSLRTAGSAAEERVLRRLLSLAASIDGATALWSHRERWGALEAPLSRRLSSVDGAAPDVTVVAAAQLWAALLRWPEARRCSASLLLRHRLDASLLAAIEPSRLRKLSSASRGGASSGRLLRAVSIAVYAPFGEGGEEEAEALVALQQALHEAGLVKTLLRALAEASPHDREVSVSLLARLVLGSRHFLRQLLCDRQCGDQGGEPCDGRCGLTAAAAAACLDPRCSAASLVNALLLLCHAARAAGSRRDLTGPGATTSAASASPLDGDWTRMLLRARLPQCLTPLLRHDELAVRSKACTLVGTLCRLSSAFYEPVRAAGLPPLVAACGTHEVSSLRRAGSFALAEVARLERLT